MILDIFEKLIYNAALLLTLSIAYDMIITHKFDNRALAKVITGIIIGIIGLAVMIGPWKLNSGTVIDAQTILFSVAALFFGAVPALIGGLIAVTYRILVGGGGVYVGVSTVISSIFWGLLWRIYHQRRDLPYTSMGLYQLGVVNHISMIFLMLLLPSEIRWPMIHAVAIPVLVIYPLATVLMGQILMRRTLRYDEKQALEKSEQEYRLLAESTKDMIVLHDVAGNISYSNKMAQDFFGKAPLSGDRAKIMEYILPESRLVLEKYAKARIEGLEGARMYQAQVWDVQRQVKTVEINSTIISGAGQDIQMLTAMRDITERMSIEEQKNRYATRLEILRELDRIVLENLPFEQVCNIAMKQLQTLIPFNILMVSSIQGGFLQMMAISKPELRHRYLNTKDLYPLNMDFRAQLIDTRNFVIPDAFKIPVAKNMPIRAALIKEGMQSFMFNAIMLRNELVGFLWFCSTKKDAFGPEHIEEAQAFANQLAIVLHQLELIKQVKEHTLDLEKQVDLRTDQLKRSMRELESFSYSVADGLQVPLKRISAYTKALEEDFEAQLGDKGKDILHAIEGQAAHLNKVITELLKLTRADNQAFHRERLNMREIVRRQLAYVPEYFSVTVDALLSTQGDATLIELVWKNLIENAVKFSIPTSTHKIHIGCELRDGQVVYSVQDEGVGFDPAQKDKVFEPFKRLHSADEFEGTGIGLALTKKIVLRHDGALWAESSLGQGSTFYFSLPYTVD